MTGPFCNDVDTFSTSEISQGIIRTLLWILYIAAMRKVRFAEKYQSKVCRIFERHYFSSRVFMAQKTTPNLALVGEANALNTRTLCRIEGRRAGCPNATYCLERNPSCSENDHI